MRFDRPKCNFPLHSRIMNVTLLQTDIVPNNVPANLADAADLMAQSPGADLYILPEMFAQGFVQTPTAADARLSADAIDWMLTAACDNDAAIGGSLVTERDGKFYNTFVLTRPDGTITMADKRHLFSMGGEADDYAPGSERVIVDVAGVRCLLLVCYDIRFPVWSRCVGQNYDAIIYVANWPTPRIGVWDVLLRARAIENQAYVIGVNRVGSAGPLNYCGHSMIIDPWGKELTRCADGEVSVTQANITAERVATVRRKFPAWADGDGFEV